MRIGKSVLFGLLLAGVAGVSYVAGAIGGGQGVMVPVEQLVFEPAGPGSPVGVAKLWGDRSQGEYGALFKIPAGFEAGLHAHSADYHAINVQGTWVHTMGDGTTKELPVGSYVMQPGGENHNDVCKGPGDCILFIHQKTKGDYIPAEKKS
jgi:quercetin dioxygenase-like cupin family protein